MEAPSSPRRGVVQSFSAECFRAQSFLVCIAGLKVNEGIPVRELEATEQERIGVGIAKRLHATAIDVHWVAVFETAQPITPPPLAGVSDLICEPPLANL